MVYLSDGSSSSSAPSSPESDFVQERILRSVFDLALQRQEDLRDAPTVATTQAIEDALQALPSKLPKRGMGDEMAFELVRRHLLPALAHGQAGPRYDLVYDLV